MITNSKQKEHNRDKCRRNCVLQDCGAKRYVKAYTRVLCAAETTLSETALNAAEELPAMKKKLAKGK